MKKCFECEEDLTLCEHSLGYSIGLELHYYMLKWDLDFLQFTNKLNSFTQSKYPEYIKYYIDKAYFYEQTLDILSNFDKCIYMGRYLSNKHCTIQNIIDLLKTINKGKRKFSSVIKL